MRFRQWLNDGSCFRLRPEYPNHVWSFDFAEAQTHVGGRIRRSATARQRPSLLHHRHRHSMKLRPYN